MNPAQLASEHFVSYRPLARNIATDNLDILRQLPLSFVPLLLVEVIAYDSKFPAERQEIDAQFAFMRGQSPERRRAVMAGFHQLSLSPALENVDWVNTPREFSEQLSAHLWTTNQVAAFRAAAIEFLNTVRAAIPPPTPAIPRLSIVVVGQGVTRSSFPLFRKLRPHGTYFSRVNPANGLRIAIERAASRARNHPVPFGHWYLDGGVPEPSPAGLEKLAYRELDTVRDAVVAKLRGLTLAGAGTEARRSALMRLEPADVGLPGDGENALLNHFKVAVLSEGSGVQFFSTTFVQWAAREVLRRAQPLTLLARFAPRLTERAMNGAMIGERTPAVLDAEGALIDADMGAYYTWLNQTRLTDAERSSFLVWFENHAEALAISPSIARGVASDRAVDMNGLLDQMSA
jgi:hypothetical protein